MSLTLWMTNRFGLLHEHFAWLFMPTDRESRAGRVNKPALGWHCNELALDRRAHVNWLQEHMCSTCRR